MTNRLSPTDPFESRLADAIDLRASGHAPLVDPHAVADAMLAARTQRRWQRGLLAASAAAIAAVMAVVVASAMTERSPDVGPQPSAAATAVTMQPSATPSAIPPQAPPLAAGSFVTAHDGQALPIFAEPGVGDSFATLEGQGFYARSSGEGPDGSIWQEIQFPYLGAWVFGWIPTTLDGDATLELLESPPCPTQVEFSQGAFIDAPRRPACLESGTWSSTGYLIRLEPLDYSPYIGEPAWLANEPEYALVGAIGPAVTSWQLPIHLDPATGIEVDEAWLSDREAHDGLRVSITGTGRHDESATCRLTATDPALADPTEQQARDFCQQRFVVSDLQPAASP